VPSESLERLFDHSPDSAVEPAGLYTRLTLPSPLPDRPAVYVNMVSTVDGKTLIGQPGSTAKGVGSATDQMLMRRLEEHADCAIIGAGTLRPGNVIYPQKAWRAVVTRSGDLPLENRFFTDAPDRVIVFAPQEMPAETRDRLANDFQVRIVGEVSVDVREAVRILRQEFGIERLLLEGGASLNFDFFAADLVDDLFLSFAPKIKGGAHLPTVVDGEGFPGREYRTLRLLSLYRDGDELYFRYRADRSNNEDV
jgi:2,5-diamino-6-(ribosylamino)-4(3H)-pyrimidinone 5'-phosphate reductase